MDTSVRPADEREMSGPERRPRAGNGALCYSCTVKTLARPERGRWIAGVCAGIGRRFGWSPGLVRLAFAVSIVLPGPQFVVYGVLWLLMPSERAGS